MKGNQTLSCVCDPQGVGNKMLPCPRVFGATPLDLWLRNGHPQGVPTTSDPARWVTNTTDFARRVPAPTDPYRWVPTSTDPYQGVPAPTDPARWGSALVDPYRRIPHPAFIALYRRGADPARDLRFIATGRAATAAMTCGQILVRTATPCGSH